MELNEDPLFREIVRHKTNLLIFMGVITEADRADIEQTLLCDVLAAMPIFDPNKAHRNVFITVVLDRSVADIVRRHRAIKRSGRPISLSTLVGADSETVELAQIITHDDLTRVRGSRVLDGQELAELKLHIDECIERLPPPLKRLAKLLKTFNFKESAQRMGIPRTTAYIRLAQLRRHFERTGLRDYLKKKPTH